jgi:hypothetical protein
LQVQVRGLQKLGGTPDFEGERNPFIKMPRERGCHLSREGGEHSLRCQGRELFVVFQDAKEGAIHPEWEENTVH